MVQVLYYKEAYGLTDDQLFGEKDIERENEILRDENRRLRLIISAYEDLTQKYFVDLRKVKTKELFDDEL